MKRQIFLIVLLLFINICLFSCANKPQEPVEYKFVITGTYITVNSDYRDEFINHISFTDPEGNNHQWENVESGWSYSWKQSGSKSIYISAINSTGQGDITITLYRNGEEVATNTGYNGTYASILKML